MKTIGFHFWRIGIYLYLQNFWKYRQIYLFPGLSLNWINGKDVYCDIDVKLLCFAVGIRIIWVKTKRNY